MQIKILSCEKCSPKSNLNLSKCNKTNLIKQKMVLIIGKSHKSQPN